MVETQKYTSREANIMEMTPINYTIVVILWILFISSPLWIQLIL